MSLMMDVYRSYHDNGQPRKDWAVAVQHGEVITRWGKSGSRLQGGDPVKRKGKSAGDVMQNLIHEKEHGGDRYRFLGRHLVDDEGVVDWERQEEFKQQSSAQPATFKSDDYLAFMRKEMLPEGWEQKVADVFAACPRFSITVGEQLVSVRHEDTLCMTLVARNRQLNVALRRDQGPYGILAALAAAKSLQALVVDNHDKPIVSHQTIQFIKSSFGQSDPEMEESAYELGLLFRMSFREDASIQSVSF